LNRGFAEIDKNALEDKREIINAYFTKKLHLNPLFMTLKH